MPQNEVIETQGMESLPAKQAEQALWVIHPDMNLEERKRAISERADYIQHAREVAVAKTYPSQWCGDPPHPERGAVNTMRLIMGMVFGEPQIERQEKEDAAGKIFTVICRLTAKWLGETFYDEGSSTSRKPFYAGKNRQVPFEDIDWTTIEKHAITNAQYRVLIKAIGLDGITWADLEALGLKRPRGDRGRSHYQRGEGKITGQGIPSKAKDELAQTLLAAFEGDKNAAQEWLFKETSKGDRKGTREPLELTHDQVEDILLPKALKLLREFEEGTGRAPGEEG